MTGKTTYIYLNKYRSVKSDLVYMYVGSHTWKGPSGKLDPSYHGTSHVARHFNWVPISEEILEVVTNESQFTAEKVWIEKYCQQYGIADVALQYAKSEGWTSKFRKHGLMLNLHANSAHQMHTPEIYRRIFENYTPQKRSIAAQKRLQIIDLYDSARKAAKTIHERSRWTNLRLDLDGVVGTPEELFKDINASKSTCEAALRKVRLQGFAYITGKLLTKEGDLKAQVDGYNSIRRCILSDGFIGSYKEIESHTGLPHGTVTTCMSNAFNKGVFSLKSGLTFKPYYKNYEQKDF